jgi:hypothetical protein
VLAADDEAPDNNNEPPDDDASTTPSSSLDEPLGPRNSKEWWSAASGVVTPEPVHDRTEADGKK